MATVKKNTKKTSVKKEASKELINGATIIMLVLIAAISGIIGWLIGYLG